MSRVVFSLCFTAQKTHFDFWEGKASGAPHQIQGGGVRYTSPTYLALHKLALLRRDLKIPGFVANSCLCHLTQNGEVELSEPGMASITQQSDDAHGAQGAAVPETRCKCRLPNGAGISTPSVDFFLVFLRLSAQHPSNLVFV